MGMNQSVSLATIPPWESICGFLKSHGLPIVVRMVDNNLIFPDEPVEEHWHELRVGSPSGMVTIRREGGGIQLIVWGNADLETQKVWNHLACAYAAVGSGTIDRDGRIFTAQEFANIFLGGGGGSA